MDLNLHFLEKFNFRTWY